MPWVVIANVFYRRVDLESTICAISKGSPEDIADDAAHGPQIDQLTKAAREGRVIGDGA